MGFRYEWINSNEGYCEVEINFDYFGSMKIDIEKLRNEYDELQKIINCWDTDKYSEEELNDFQSKFDLLDEFVTRS